MKNQKNNTPKESTDWNDFWKNLKERSNGKIQKPVLGIDQVYPGKLSNELESVLRPDIILPFFNSDLIFPPE